MLDDDEWAILSPHMGGWAQKMMNYVKTHRASLEEAQASGEFATDALDCYFKLTGYRETYPNNLWHYRATMYGPPCKACGKPLRTPRAKHCAECGHVVQAAKRIT